MDLEGIFIFIKGFETLFFSSWDLLIVITTFINKSRQDQADLLLLQVLLFKKKKKKIPLYIDKKMFILAKIL